MWSKSQESSCAPDFSPTDNSKSSRQPNGPARTSNGLTNIFFPEPMLQFCFETQTNVRIVNLLDILFAPLGIYPLWDRKSDCCGILSNILSALLRSVASQTRVLRSGQRRGGGSAAWTTRATDGSTAT